MSDASLRREVASRPIPELGEASYASSPPIESARVGLVTTAGLMSTDAEGWKRGDQSFRVVAHDQEDLVVGHPSANFDRSGALVDPNVVLPRERLDELAAAKAIGGVAPRHLSFMGAQHDTLATLRGVTGPRAAALLADDGVDAVVLTPVCPMCALTVCVLGHVLEREGIATVAIVNVRELAARARPPRALFCEFPFGRPLGRPSDPPFQRRVLEAALGLLDQPSGPVLADFPEAVAGEGETMVSCPLPPRLDRELHPAVDEVLGWRAEFERVRREGNGFGWRLDVDRIPTYVERFARIAAGEPWDAEEWDQAPTVAALDVRWYFEAVASARQPEVPTAHATERWFFEQTETGRVLLEAQRRMREQGAPRGIWRRLVPLEYVDESNPQEGKSTE